jgi:uncharacterized protein involved in response to NO
MLFGFGLATIAGFLLTAVSNWTGRPPLLEYLAALWLLGRMTCLVSALIAAWLGVALDLVFPIVAGVIAREIVAAQNRRNLPIVAAVALLAGADLLVRAQGTPKCRLRDMIKQTSRRNGRAVFLIRSGLRAIIALRAYE